MLISQSVAGFITWSGQKMAVVHVAGFTMLSSQNIRGLCLVLNRNWFCLMPVHTCFAECA